MKTNKDLIIEPNAAIEGRKYSEEKPWSCKYCYWWGGKKKGCSLKQCHYLLPEKKKAVKTTPCGGCPYGKHVPCIGYCIARLYSEMKGKKDEATNTNEVLPEDGTDKGTAFTTPGNGEVKDDITDDSTKEFLTVTTKNNNTFYIVIDRSATSQNVYMLSQIDENDLSEFLDKDSTATVVTPQPDKSKVVLDETNNEDVDKEATVDPEKTSSAKSNMGAMATILILALGGVAAYYYFKIYKPKKEEEEDDQPEGLETGGLEEVPDEEESEDEDFEENEK